MCSSRPQSAQEPEGWPYWRRVLENEAHDVPDNIAINFSAVWRVKVEMITGRLCRVSAASSAENEDDRFSGDITDLRQAQLDSYLLARTAAHAVDATRAGGQMVHIVPVSFRSIDRDPHRLKILGVLQSLPEEIRRLIVCEIIDLPANVSLRRLREPLARVQALCRSTMVQLPLSTSDFRGWREAGVNTIGVMLPAELAPTRDLVRRLDAFSFKARTASLTAYVWGIETKLTAAACLAADFGYLSGSLLDSLIGDVDNVRTLTLKQLYQAA